MVCYKPYTILQPRISRIVGNIDHPVGVMLAPPQAPLVRTQDSDFWRLINHHRFDGKLEDYFSEISLHLSFTIYILPLSVPVDAMDSGISIIEALISTHD